MKKNFPVPFTRFVGESVCSLACNLYDKFFSNLDFDRLLSTREITLYEKKNYSGSPKPFLTIGNYLRLKGIISFFSPER